MQKFLTKSEHPFQVRNSTASVLLKTYLCAWLKKKKEILIVENMK